MKKEERLSVVFLHAWIALLEQLSMPVFEVDVCPLRFTEKLGSDLHPVFAVLVEANYQDGVLFLN